MDFSRESVLVGFIFGLWLLGGRRDREAKWIWWPFLKAGFSPSFCFQRSQQSFSLPCFRKNRAFVPNWEWPTILPLVLTQGPVDDRLPYESPWAHALGPARTLESDDRGKTRGVEAHVKNRWALYASGKQCKRLAGVKQSSWYLVQKWRGLSLKNWNDTFNY